MQVKLEWLQENGKYKCPYCDKEYSKKGIGYHIWKNHTEEGKQFDPNRGYKDGTRKSVIWNIGLTKETDKRVARNALNIKNSPNNTGGYKHGSGRGKHGWYKGNWCDSSWELAFIIYNLEHNIPFTRNKDGFEYEYNGEKHKYYPDFIMEDGTYVEIKNYETEKTHAKHSQFPYKLKIICGKKEIKPYLDYVIKKYGKEFINLYENK